MASHGTPYAWHRWKGLTLTHQTGPEEDHTLGTTEGKISKDTINCTFGNFCENFIFANSVKRHISDVKNSQQGHELPTQSHLAILRGFIFMKLRIWEVS